MKRILPLPPRRPTEATGGDTLGTVPLMRLVKEGTVGDSLTNTSLAEFLHQAEQPEVNTAVLLYPHPSREQVMELAELWDLHPVLVEDLIVARQRPKVERYGPVMFVVARASHYVDSTEEVRSSEFHLLMRGTVIVVLCQDGRWLDARLPDAFDEGDPGQLDPREEVLVPEHSHRVYGPEAVVYRMIDAIVDGLQPALRGVMIDKEEIEGQVFTGDAKVAQRIYRLNQEVIDTQHIVNSLEEVVSDLQRGFTKYGVPQDLQAYLGDVADHLAHAERAVSRLRDSLAQILQVNATLVAQRQNDDMKKISGWAAILFAPTLIGAIYGMNFDHMPELHWVFGYPFALALMIGVGVGLYIFFRVRKWM